MPESPGRAGDGPASRLAPAPSAKLPAGKAAGWLLRNRRARPARRKSPSPIHLCSSCMCQSRKRASKQLSRHLMSRLLAGLYTFACGISAYANTDGLLSRFQLGLLFLIGKFSCHCEALSGLPAASQQKKKTTQQTKTNIPTKILARKTFCVRTDICLEIFDLIAVYSHQCGILSLSAAIAGNGSAVPGDLSSGFQPQRFQLFHFPLWKCCRRSCEENSCFYTVS